MIEPPQGVKRIAEAADGRIIPIGADNYEISNRLRPGIHLVPADMDHREVEDQPGAVQREHFRMEGAVLIENQATLHPFPHVMQE